MKKPAMLVRLSFWVTPEFAARLERHLLVVKPVSKVDWLRTAIKEQMRRELPPGEDTIPPGTAEGLDK